MPIGEDHVKHLRPCLTQPKESLETSVLNN